MKHDANSRKQTVKVQPKVKKISLKSPVIAVERSEKKVDSKVKTTKPIFLTENVKPKTKSNKSREIIPAVKRKSKAVKAAASGKTGKSKTVEATKTKIQKLKPASSAGKIKVAGKKGKLKKTVQTIKPKTKIKSVAAAPKFKARKVKQIVSAKKITPVEKKKISPVSIKKVEKPSSAKVKLNASEKSIKFKAQKPQANVSVKKAKIVGGKNKQNVVAQKTKSQAKNNKAAKSVQAIKQQLQKVQPVISAKKITDKRTEIKSAQSNKNTFIEKIESKGKPIKLDTLAKTIKLERNKVIKAKTRKTEPIVPTKMADVIKVETVNSPVEKKLTKNKNKPIGAAVFRGRKDRYDFKVFPLDNYFEDVSAIYVISRRKIDREKKGHHALVCIGQTDSILGEIKRHKNKCIKKHNANVISILPEADEKKRLKIEEDLRAAHAIACNVS